MNSSISISCVVPTHERDELLQEALESVAAQTLQPLEVIVVDDVGSEKTAALVHSFADYFSVQYLDASHLSVKGAGASRNLGVAAASGSHVAFLDDDDIWKPSFLEECRNALGENCPLSVSWASYLAAGREHDGHSMPADISMTEAISKNPGLTGSNFVISREVFHSLNGFDTSLWVSNDRDFLIRFLEAGNSYTIVENRLLLQRIHEEGQLTNRTERRAKGIEVFRNKHLSKMTDEDLRLVNREIWSIRRVSDPSRISRLSLTFRQLSTYRPLELVATVSSKLLGHRPTYN